MNQLKGEACDRVGCLQLRENSSSSTPLFPEHTHERKDEVRLVQRTPSELIRTKTSATCSSSTAPESSTALNG